MKDWPWYYFVVIAVVAFAFFYMLYFKPKSSELKSVTEERITIEREVQQLRVQKKRKDALEIEIKSMAETLEDLETVIPKIRETSYLLSGTQQLAYDSNLDIKKYVPKGEVQKEFYSDWPISIEINGNYHNLGRFFARLSNFPRLFTIEDFTIKALPKQGELQTITASCTAQSYIIRENVPDNKIPEAKKKPEGKKKPAAKKGKRR